MGASEESVSGSVLKGSNFGGGAVPVAVLRPPSRARIRTVACTMVLRVSLRFCCSLREGHDLSIRGCVCQLLGKCSTSAAACVRCLCQSRRSLGAFLDHGMRVVC